MTVVVYSASESYKQHLDSVVGAGVRHKSDLKLSTHDLKADLYIIHIKSYGISAWLSFINDVRLPIQKVVVADDLPNVAAMLRYTQQGLQAYCNSYMAATHYEQLIKLLKNGQSWYPPELLAQAFSLAHQNVNHVSYDDKLEVLTPREKQIALSVVEGKSNKAVAREYDISERTVKAHLSHIFEKLNIKDRMALVLYLKQQGYAKTGT